MSVPPASVLAVADINSDGIVEWGVRNLIPIILLFIGIAIIASARKGKLSDNASTITNVLLGLCVIAGAAVLYGFAGELTELVFAN
jgi:hypothetical protein